MPWQNQLTTLFQAKSGQATLGMTQHNHVILCQQNGKFTTQGKPSGTIIGGNLSTFGLLRGTPYAPQVNDYILFLEQAEADNYLDFDRNLAAILQAYSNPKAVIIGRFPKECQMTPEILTYILDKHPLLKTIPVMYDLDFAHTQPLFTITIGAQASIDTDTLSIHIEE